MPERFIWLWLCLGLSMCSSAWSTSPLVRWDPPDWGPLSPHLGLGHAAGRIADGQRVVAIGPHFFTPGPDGELGTPDDVRMRWYGINVAGVAAFPTADGARQLSRTLASWGFNAVRIHYIDAPPHPDPAVVNSVLSDGPYPSFNPVAIERLRHLLAELRDQGLYVQLNPIAAYTLRPQQDGVPPLAPPAPLARGAAGNAEARLPANHPLAAIHPDLLQRQQTYLTQLAQHLDLRHQPALAMVDAVNESSLLATWTQWDPKGWVHTVSGEYAQRLEGAWARWVDRTHGGLPAALQAWGLPASTPLPTPTPTEPHGVGLSPGGNTSSWWSRAWQRVARLVDLLPPAWRATVSGWLRANSPLPNGVLHDYLRFLTELDRQHGEALRATLRESIRPDLPVTGTQVGYGNGWGTVAQAGMDFVDDHLYVDHYQFAGTNWDMNNWYVSREALSGQAWPRLVGAAALRDRTRPYIISEFGQPYPNPLGPEMALTLATLARLQDWDGLFLFDHDAFDTQRRAPAHFDIQGDWPRAVVSALASRVLLSDGLAAIPAETVAQADPASFTASWLRQRRPDYWSHELQQATPPALADALQAWGYGPAPQTATPHSDRTSPMLRHSAGRLSADWATGAWVSGRFVGASQGLMGEVHWALPVGHDEQLATLVLVSGDGLPLGQSRHWLLGVVTPTVGSSASATPPMPHTWAQHPSGSQRWTLAPVAGAAGPSEPPNSVPPLWTEPPRLRLELPARAAQAQVWRLGARGEHLGQVGLLPGSQGRWHLPTGPAASGQPPSMWFDIRWAGGTP